MGQCAHSIAQFQCCAALANRDYLAGHFQSWYGGRVLRRRIKPEALQQVGAIDTGMIHFYQHLLRAGRGAVPVTIVASSGVSKWMKCLSMARFSLSDAGLLSAER